TIDVVKFQLDTAELYTIERMSNAVPVLLFVVDVNKDQVYFLCLNDYIDKVLIPSDPNYYEKKTKTIYIPRKNLLTSNSLFPLIWYAKRPKLYSLFNKIRYQVTEMEYMSEEQLISVYPHFLNK